MLTPEYFLFFSLFFLLQLFWLTQYVTSFVIILQFLDILFLFCPIFFLCFEFGTFLSTYAQAHWYFSLVTYAQRADKVNKSISISGQDFWVLVFPVDSFLEFPSLCLHCPSVSARVYIFPLCFDIVIIVILKVLFNNF